MNVKLKNISQIKSYIAIKIQVNYIITKIEFNIMLHAWRHDLLPLPL